MLKIDKDHFDRWTLNHNFTLYDMNLKKEDFFFIFKELISTSVEVWVKEELVQWRQKLLKTFPVSLITDRATNTLFSSFPVSL